MSFYIGIALLFPAILFRIQHWVGGNNLLLASLVCETVFFLLVILEIARSPKLTVLQKCVAAIIFAVPFLFALLFLRGLFLIAVVGITGLGYLGFARKKVVPPKNAVKHIQFDSI